MPDIVAKQIIDNEITPNFRANNFYRGFDAATTAIKRLRENTRLPKDITNVEQPGEAVAQP